MNRNQNVKTVLIVGASSGLARAIASGLAEKGYPLILAGRDQDETRAVAADLRVRFRINTTVQRFDALDIDSHLAFFQACVSRADQHLQGIVVCHGYLTTGQPGLKDLAECRRMIDVNYTSFVSILNLAADYFEARQIGFICALSSVAGDRGRPSNYVYGSTKAAVTTYLQGLRARLAGSRVAVITVKPGFIDTGMTWGFRAPGPVGSARTVGRDVCRAIARGRSVVYTPWYYRWIMLMIRLIPEAVYKRLNL